MEENKELQVIEQETNGIIATANLLNITDQESYNSCVEFTKNIKNATSKVKDYWKIPKENAAKVHKDIVAKEKEMLIPLTTAEQIVKTKMINYVTEQERRRKEEESRIKAEQEKMALEQLKKAEELRKQGNEVEAQITEQNAVAISEVETKIEPTVSKVDGISYQTDYEIIVTDPTKVPSYVNGIEIRKIDTSAIKKLIKMTGNTTKIVGIEVKETKIAKVRR